MRCLDPRTVGFQADGKTISWSQKTSNPEFATFQLPCGQCLACRLEYARQWAIRCIHEAEMHEKNSFITLTYADEHLTSERLQYDHFQKFMKRLRFHEAEKNLLPEEMPAGYFVTGEYGDKRKRPHWHAIIFNWRPDDLHTPETNERGDITYQSHTLSALWPFGRSNLGTVTFESAGYCARYAAKKLTHGRDSDHEFHPISKKSSKHAIGKKFVEKYHESIFNLGFINLPNGKKCGIPRYYEKWLKKEHPHKWAAYVTQKKLELTNKAKEKNDKQIAKENHINATRRAFTNPRRSQKEARKKILASKFKQLQSNLKL